MGSDADARGALAREILGLQRAFNAAAWRLAGSDLTLPDLTPQQLRVLMIVTRQPGLAASTLSHELGVTAPTASGIVERLVDKGLLARTEDRDDRRVRRLELTPAGQGVLMDLDSASERMFGRLMPLISTETMATIRDTYVTLLDAVHDGERTGAFD